MKFHAFMYVTIGRRRELEQGMAGKNPVLYQRMLDEIGAYARLCDEAGYAGIGIPEHHLQIEGFELGQDPGLMAMYMGMQTQRLRINQFGYVLRRTTRCAWQSMPQPWTICWAVASTLPSCAAIRRAGSRIT